MGLGEEDPCLGVREHVRDPLGGIVGLERNVRRPRGQDAQEPHHDLGGALCEDRNPVLGTDSKANQVLGQLTHATTQLRVAQLSFLEGERNGIRGPSNLAVGRARAGKHPVRRSPRVDSGR